MSYCDAARDPDVADAADLPIALPGNEAGHARQWCLVEVETARVNIEACFELIVMIE